MTGEIISVEEWRKRLTPGILTSLKNAGVVLRERAPLGVDADDYLLGIIADYIAAIRVPEPPVLRRKEETGGQRRVEHIAEW